MAELSGRIIVQEERFLPADDGGHRLFIASHSRAFNPQDLRAPGRDRRRIRMRFRQPDHLVAGIAEKIEPANGLQAPHHNLADGISRLVPRLVAAAVGWPTRSLRCDTMLESQTDPEPDLYTRPSGPSGRRRGTHGLGERLNDVPFAIADRRANGG